MSLSHLGTEFYPFFFCESDTSWDSVTAELRAEGVSLPVQADRGFPRSPGESRMIVGVRDGTGCPIWGAVAQIEKSRIIPWRTVVRLPRFGAQAPRTATHTIGKSLIELAKRTAALRLHCEVLEPDPFEREHLIAQLKFAGFRLHPSPRLYSDTVLIDMRRPEDDILASFHATGRRHIRAVAKHGLRCERVNVVSVASRLEALTRETMARTGGKYVETDWAAVIDYANRQPSRAILLGVYRPDVAEPDSLIGYVLGFRHGNVIEYSNAASARLSDLRAPLLYAPTWELMKWGKGNGAEWFDFGGVSTTRRHGPGATAGIADFKLYFSADTTEVGCELVYSPSAVLESAARLASAALQTFRATGGER